MKKELNVYHNDILAGSLLLNDHGRLEFSIWHWRRLREVITRKAFTDPPSSVDAKQHWRMESDQVAQFLEECCGLYKDYEAS